MLKNCQPQKKMAKIHVLKNNQIFMTPLGIYSYRLTEPINEFYTSFAPYYIEFFVLIFLTFSTAVFTLQNVAQIDLALQNVSLFTAGIQCAGMFINIGAKMKTVKLFHLKLQDIVDAGIVSELFIFFLDFHPVFDFILISVLIFVISL